MNCVTPFVLQAQSQPSRLAIWCDASQQWTYGQLLASASRAQAHLLATDRNPSGKTLLLAVPPSLDTYAWVSAAVGLGISVVFVEPWLPLTEIDDIVTNLNPQWFVGTLVAQLWGLRSQAIRAVPHKWFAKAWQKSAEQPFHVEDVEPSMPGIITFTSGTTGKSKGLIRSHGLLSAQEKSLARAEQGEQDIGVDLTIFANFVLANLARGRPSVVMPQWWKKSQRAKLRQLTDGQSPERMTVGPACLRALLDEAAVLPKLRHAFVGGAPIPITLVQEAMAKYPKVAWHVLYGSTEVEPVAVATAEESIAESQKRGAYHCVYFGMPVSELSVKVAADSLWVSGQHVAPEYLRNEAETVANKWRDPKGALWHRMWDAIRIEPSGLVYEGRSAQKRENFWLEQALYHHLGHDNAFLDVTADGRKVFYAVIEQKLEAGIIEKWPEVTVTVVPQVLRDRRHRARIDRVKSKETGWRAKFRGGFSK